MGMFISGEVIVTELGIIDAKDLTPEKNAIIIRPKMDYGTRQKVIGAAARIQANQSGNRKQRRAAKSRGDALPVDFDLGAYQIALLEHNILRWQGPAFMGHACTPSNIQALNPEEPLVERVIQEISDRNTSIDDTADDDETADPNVLTLPATTS